MSSLIVFKYDCKQDYSDICKTLLILLDSYQRPFCLACSRLNHGAGSNNGEEGSQYWAGLFDLNNTDNLVYTILSKVSDLCLTMELTETNFQNMQLQFDSKLNVVDEKICQIFEENI